MFFCRLVNLISAGSLHMLNCAAAYRNTLNNPLSSPCQLGTICALFYITGFHACSHKKSEVEIMLLGSCLQTLAIALFSLTSLIIMFSDTSSEAELCSRILQTERCHFGSPFLGMIYNNFFPKMFVSGVDITNQAKVFILPLTF